MQSMKNIFSFLLIFYSSIAYTGPTSGRGSLYQRNLSYLSQYYPTKYRTYVEVEPQSGVSLLKKRTFISSGLCNGFDQFAIAQAIEETIEHFSNDRTLHHILPNALPGFRRFIEDHGHLPGFMNRLNEIYQRAENICREIQRENANSVGIEYKDIVRIDGTRGVEVSIGSHGLKGNSKLLEKNKREKITAKKQLNRVHEAVTDNVWAHLTNAAEIEDGTAQQRVRERNIRNARLAIKTAVAIYCPLTIPLAATTEALHYYRENQNAHNNSDVNLDQQSGGRTITVYFMGTASSSSDADYSESLPRGELISSLAVQTVGVENVDWIRLEGIGTYGHAASFEQAAGWSVNTSMTKKADHALSVIKANSNTGFSNFELRDSTRAPGLEKIEQCIRNGFIRGVDRINVIGWSRGGVTAIKFAHKLFNDPDLRDIPVNLFTVDPVPGSVGWTWDKETRVIHPNVKNFVSVYAADERTKGFSAIVPHIEDPNITNSSFIRFPGHHGTVVGYVTDKTGELPTIYNFNATGLLVRHLVEKFLQENGTILNNALDLNILEQLQLYESIMENKNGYESFRNYVLTPLNWVSNPQGPDRFVWCGRNGNSRPFNEILPETRGFINSHHASLVNSELVDGDQVGYMEYFSRIAIDGSLRPVPDGLDSHAINGVSEKQKVGFDFFSIPDIITSSRDILNNINLVTVSGFNNRCWLRSAWAYIFNQLENMDDNSRNQFWEHFPEINENINQDLVTALRDHYDIIRVSDSFSRSFGLARNGQFSAQLEEILFRLTAQILVEPEARRFMNNNNFGEDEWMDTLIRRVGIQEQNLPIYFSVREGSYRRNNEVAEPTHNDLIIIHHGGHFNIGFLANERKN